MAGSLTSRCEMAERWRVAGERLRRRSPKVFAKVFEMLVTSEPDDDAEGEQRIDEIYRLH